MTNIDKWIFNFPEVVEIAKFQSVFSESDRAHMVTGYQRPLRARIAPSWHYHPLARSARAEEIIPTVHAPEIHHQNYIIC